MSQKAKKKKKAKIKKVSFKDKDWYEVISPKIFKFKPIGDIIGLDNFRLVWESLIPKLRIICLSEINDSMPMWAHYANNHRGVVLELECIEEIDSPWLIARPVIYQDTLPLFITKEALVDSITGRKPLDYEEIFKE